MYNVKESEKQLLINKYIGFILFLITNLIYRHQSQISIKAPLDIVKIYNYKNINIINSLYGFIPYGQMSSVKIMNNNSTYSENEFFYGCSDDYDFIDKKSVDEKLPSGLIVDRGECTFVNKTRNAQNAGADLLIIIDDIDEKKNDSIVLVDDGTASDIVIPTVMISKKDGQKIKDYLKDSSSSVNKNNNLNELNNKLKHIIIDINFEITKLQKVDFELFVSSEEIEVYNLIKELKHYMPYMSDHVNFNVHYVSYKSDLSNTNNTPIDNCFGSGSYCNWGIIKVDEYYDNDAKELVDDVFYIDGRKILSENIRQKCIYDISYNYKKSNNNMFDSKDSLESQKYPGEIYFNYMDKYYSECLKGPFETIFYSNNDKSDIDYSNLIYSRTCSAYVLLNITSNYEDYEKCYKNSFTSLNDKEVHYEEINEPILKNKLLENGSYIQTKYNIQLIPSVSINKKELYGSLQAYNVIEAICAGLDIVPEFCYTNSFYKKVETTSNDLSTLSIVTIIILVIIINIIIVFFCKRFVVKKLHEKIDSAEMNGKINNVVTSYLALRDK